MSIQSINNLEDNLQKLYPSLFDDPSAKDKLNPLVDQANIFLKQYKSQVSDKDYLQLVQLFTAHLLYQTEDHDISSVHAADVSFSLQNNRSGSGSSGDGGSYDPYLTMFERLLQLLGFQPWSIQFD